MDREIWTKISDIFDAALDRPLAERESYVAEACSGNDTLLVQVRQLLSEFYKAEGFLEQSPMRPSRALQAGDIIGGRYHIEAALGGGGMGEVYRAHDSLGGELIALKTLHRELGEDPGFVAQFRREVQLSRKVTHPNVCRVFEVGIHSFGEGSGIHFFTMELLAGETLAARIRRAGPFSPEEAYPLVVQITEGLAAAHRAHVVHRDFKSGNVMLSGARAVVTDFGLARIAVTAASGGAGGTITAQTQLAGTVAYMSPEQLANRTVTTATDIYSLGVVLFEMITARLPFSDRHIIESAMERAADAAPDVRALAPEMNARWAAAITRCLQRDPARRYSTATEVAAELEPRWQAPMRYWSRRQWLVAAGAGVLSVALVPIVWRYAQPKPSLSDGARALLIPITNSTGDRQLDGIAELFRSQLAQSTRLNLLDRASLAPALDQMQKPVDDDDPSDLLEAGYRRNAAVSIFGSVSKVGPQYALSVQVETRGSAPNRPRTTSLHSFAASDSGALMRSVRDATLWVRTIIGESAAEISTFDRLPEDTTTPSWKALTLYARGQQFFMNQNFNPAIDKFLEALEVDPKFTLAALRRADLLVSQNRPLEGFAQYRAAMVMLADRQVTRQEELYGLGMFALDSGDFVSANRHLRTWALEYPHDWRARFYRVMPLCMTGYAAEALELTKALLGEMPEYADHYAQTIWCLLVLGETAEARALLPAFQRLSEPQGRADRARMLAAHALFRDGDCVGCLEALRAVGRSTTVPRFAADAALYETLLLIDTGYPEAAADNADAFLRAGSWEDARPQQTILLIAQAWAEMLAGRLATAAEHAEQAVKEQNAALTLALAGTIFARAGALDLANDALQRCAVLEEIAIYRIARHRIQGELARSAGDDNRALAELQIAADLEPTIAHKQYLIEALPAGNSERLRLVRAALRAPWQNLRPPPIHHIGAMGVAVADALAAGIDDAFARRFAESSKQLKNLI